MMCSSSAMRQKNGTANARQIPRKTVLIIVPGIGDPGWEHDDPASWPGSTPPATGAIPAKAGLFIGGNARAQLQAAHEDRVVSENRSC